MKQEERRLTVRTVPLVQAFDQACAEFHQRVCRASHNDRLLQALQALLDHVRQLDTSTLYNEGRPAQAIAEYRSLLEAIEARDADRAEKLAREHRRKTLELRKEMLREQLRKSRSVGSDSDSP